jgi:hypothetical protein
MTLKETLEQLPGDFEITIKAIGGTVEYSDTAGQFLEDAEHKVIRLEDFELITEVYFPQQNGYPLPPDLRAYQHGDIGGHIETPADIVIQGPIGEWIKTVEPETEATMASLGAGLIAGLGAYMGRDIKLKVGRITHMGNLFVVQVGPTSTARKGTADSEIHNFLYQLDASFSMNNIASGFGSGEALIERVADPQENSKGEIVVGTEDQRLYIQEGEFSKVLRIADRQGSVLADVIRLAFDGKRPLANAAKTTRKLISSRHCISLFGGITPDELLKIFPALAAVSGTGNRYLWVWSDSTKLLPYGGSEVEIRSIVQQVRQNITDVRRTRTLEYSADARDWWEAHYAQLRKPDWVPGSVQPMISRISDQTQRIALIYAATQGSKEVTVDHLAAGYAWVEHSIQTVRAVMGGLVRNEEAGRILASLRQHPGVPATKKEIYDIFSRNTTATALDAALGELEEVQLAYSWTGPSVGGRPPTMVMATTPKQRGREDLLRSFDQKQGSEGPETFVRNVAQDFDINPGQDTNSKNEKRGFEEMPPESPLPNTKEVSPDDLPDPW